MLISIPEQYRRAMHRPKTSDDLHQLYHRLKTKRQKKRLVHEGRDRRLRRLGRELNRLEKQETALGWEDLEEPVQRGWKRTFVLREDIARSKQAAFYQQILDKINTVQYCKRKDFMVKSYGKKAYKKMEQETAEITEQNIVKHGLTEKEFKLFVLTEKRTRWSRRTYFSFSEPWRFELKIQPNIVTRQRIGSAQIDSQISEIDQHLHRSFLYPRLTKIKGGSYGAWRFKQEDERYKNPYKNTPLHQMVAAAKEEYEH